MSPALLKGGPKVTAANASGTHRTQAGMSGTGSSQRPTIPQSGVIGTRPVWDPQRPTGPSFRCIAVPGQGYRSGPALIPGSTGDLT